MRPRAGDDDDDDFDWATPESHLIWRDHGAAPAELTVDWVEPEPIGELLGPDGETLAWVYEDRLPFGFQPRG